MQGRQHAALRCQGGIQWQGVPIEPNEDIGLGIEHRFDAGRMGVTSVQNPEFPLLRVEVTHRLASGLVGNPNGSRA